MGYIGSFIASTLLKRGDEVHIIDNLSNSFTSTLDRIEDLCGFRPKFSCVDIRDSEKLDSELEKFKPDIVVHLAALKSVEESMKDPLNYYDHNVTGLLNVLKAMNTVECEKLVYSSSAAVYGSSDVFPINEECLVSAQSVYGETKAIGEKLIQDWANTAISKSAVSLRYFNPVGAHPSVTLGENSRTPPSGVMPLICAAGQTKGKIFHIYGSDYMTADGTAERDFIHIMDLAEAHQSAIDYCIDSTNYEVFNVGTGVSVSILDLLSTFEQITGQKIPYVYSSKRAGDVPRSLASVDKASMSLGWRAQRSLDDMCLDAWNWSLKNYKN